MIILSLKEELYYSYNIILYIFVLINKPQPIKGSKEKEGYKIHY